MIDSDVANTVWATAVVLATWALVGAVIVGLGLLTRRALFRLVRVDASPQPCGADLWTGLAALVVWLLASSVVLPVDWRVWPVPAGLGAVGLVLAIRERTGGWARPSWRWAALIGVVVVVLANVSLGPSTAYDSGLYHFSAVDWISDSAAQPGLANVHVRLASAASHLLLVASLGVGPWTAAGQHLANGLIGTLLLVQVLLAVRPPRGEGGNVFSRRLAILIVPTVVLVLGADATSRVSSPNLDPPVFMLLLASALAAAQAVERGFDPRYVLGASCALAAALGTRLHVAPAIVVLAGMTFVLARNRGLRGGVLGGLVVLPALVVTSGVALRQSILSGYPFFPASTPSLAVDWRVPEAVVDDYRGEVESWAREPGNTSPEVTASWDWLGPWLERTAGQVDVAPAVAMLALVPFLGLAAQRRPTGVTTGLRAAAIVLVPAAVSLLVWFWTAPDPRFALGWIWLVAIGTIALLIPSSGGSRASVVPIAVVVTALWAWAALSVGRAGDGFVRADGDGSLGSHAPVVPETRSFVTRSGLVVQTPTESDLCWVVELCTPTPSADLRLRAEVVEDGFMRAAP